MKFATPRCWRHCRVRTRRGVAQGRRGRRGGRGRFSVGGPRGGVESLERQFFDRLSEVDVVWLINPNGGEKWWFSSHGIPICKKSNQKAKTNPPKESFHPFPKSGISRVPITIILRLSQDFLWILTKKKCGWKSTVVFLGTRKKYGKEKLYVLWYTYINYVNYVNVR